MAQNIKAEHTVVYDESSFCFFLYRSWLKSRLVSRWMWYTPKYPNHTQTHTNTPPQTHKHTPSPPFSCAPFRKKQHASAPVTVLLLDNITLRKNIKTQNKGAEMLVFIKTRQLNLATYFVPIMGQHKRSLKIHKLSLEVVTKYLPVTVKSK